MSYLAIKKKKNHLGNLVKGEERNHISLSKTMQCISYCLTIKAGEKLRISAYHHLSSLHTIRIQNPMLPLATELLSSKQMYMHHHCVIISQESTFTP